VFIFGTIGGGAWEWTCRIHARYHLSQHHGLHSFALSMTIVLYDLYCLSPNFTPRMVNLAGPRTVTLAEVIQSK